MDFRCIASFLNSPDSVEDLSIYSPMSDDDVIHVKVTQVYLQVFFQQMSRVMRKSTICICENKGADQFRGSYMYDNVFLYPKFQASSLLL